MSQNINEPVKLLFEYQDANIKVEESLNENNEKTKKYKIEGVFSTIGQKNKNGRIYPKAIWEANVLKYQDVIKSGSINRLCEWQHPERTNVDPMEAVAVINKLEINGDYVIGEATLLDNPKANQLKSLIDNGVKLSVSSRGTGSVKDSIVESFNLITYDLVDNPSDYNASMHGKTMYESEKEFIMVDGRLVEHIKTEEKENNENNTQVVNEDNQDKQDEQLEIKRQKLKKSFEEFLVQLKNKK